MTNMKKLAIFTSDGPIEEGSLNVGISLEHKGLGVLEISRPNQPSSHIHLKPEVLRRIADAAYRAADYFENLEELRDLAKKGT